jgi:hypothetical protein
MAIGCSSEQRMLLSPLSNAILGTEHRLMASRKISCTLTILLAERHGCDPIWGPDYRMACVAASHRPLHPSCRIINHVQPLYSPRACYHMKSWEIHLSWFVSMVHGQVRASECWVQAEPHAVLLAVANTIALPTRHERLYQVLHKS